MKASLLIFIIALIMAINVPLHQAAEAGSLNEHSGLITGENYLKLTELEKINYVAGLIDGVAISEYFGADLMVFNGCMKRKSLAEFATLLTRYISKTPEDWKYSANSMFLLVYRENCLPM
jgi:hypothetical protein